MNNWMAKKLLPHVGHGISCVTYGDSNDPDDICIECEDCCAELVSAEDFNKIAELFSERLRKQVDTVKVERTARDLPFAALTQEHCRKRGSDGSLDGKLVILRPSSLAPEYHSADYQLGYALGGFDCSPNARERAVYFKELYSGETCRWDCGDADLDKLPEWAKEKVKGYEDHRHMNIRAATPAERLYANEQSSRIAELCGSPGSLFLNSWMRNVPFGNTPEFKAEFNTVLDTWRVFVTPSSVLRK